MKWKIFKGKGSSLIEVISRDLGEEIQLSMETLSQNTRCPVEIRIADLSNKSLQRYGYTNQLNGKR
jgi:hypothetical protein